MTVKHTPWQTISALAEKLLFGVVLAVCLLLVVSFLPLPTRFRLLSVMSGSMEPAIPVGSLTVVVPSQSYNIGDIISFRHPDQSDLYTHRIIGIESTGFLQTKGDANDVPDQYLISTASVVGKVTAIIPYLGYATFFGKTPAGFLAIIVVPGLLILWQEVRNIRNELKRQTVHRKRRSVDTLSPRPATANARGEATAGTKTLLLILLLLVVGVGYEVTRANFASRTAVTPNSYTTAE